MSFTQRKNSLCWGVGAAAVLLACFLVNAGGAWWEYGPVTPWNLLTTLGYLTFWGVFTRGAASHPGRLRIVRGMAALSLLASLTALLVRLGAGDLWTVPALLLAPLSAVPMYGLRCFLSWDALYGLCAALSALWLAYGLIQRKKG